MSLPLIIKPSAQDDIDDAYSWYENQQIGRGDDFLAELQGCLDDIKQQPRTFGRRWGQVRAAPMKQSKFIIYYRIKVDSITVVAVQHARANPKNWLYRK